MTSGWWVLTTSASMVAVACDAGETAGVEVRPMGATSNLRWEPVELDGTIYAGAYQDGGPFGRWDDFVWTDVTFTSPDGTVVSPRWAVSNGRDGMLVADDGLYPFIGGEVGDRIPGSEIAKARTPRMYDAELGVVTSWPTYAYFDAARAAWLPTNAIEVTGVAQRPDGRLVILAFNIAHLIGPEGAPREDILNCPLEECASGVHSLHFFENGDLLFSTGEARRFWRKSGTDIVPVADLNGSYGASDASVQLFGETLVATQRTENTAVGVVNVTARTLSTERLLEWGLLKTGLGRLMSAWRTTSHGVILWDGADGGMYMVGP